MSRGRTHFPSVFFIMLLHSYYYLQKFLRMTCRTIKQVCDPLPLSNSTVGDSDCHGVGDRERRVLEERGGWWHHDLGPWVVGGGGAMTGPSKRRSGGWLGLAVEGSTTRRRGHHWSHGWPMDRARVGGATEDVRHGCALPGGRVKAEHRGGRRGTWRLAGARDQSCVCCSLLFNTFRIFELYILIE
jgi:hypothetical protein